MSPRLCGQLQQPPADRPYVQAGVADPDGFRGSVAVDQCRDQCRVGVVEAVAQAGIRVTGGRRCLRRSWLQCVCCSYCSICLIVHMAAQRLRLSRADWETHRRAEVGMERLEPCLPMFGLPAAESPGITTPDHR